MWGQQGESGRASGKVRPGSARSRKRRRLPASHPSPQETLEATFPGPLPSRVYGRGRGPPPSARRLLKLSVITRRSPPATPSQPGTSFRPLLALPLPSPRLLRAWVAREEMTWCYFRVRSASSFSSALRARAHSPGSQTASRSRGSAAVLRPPRPQSWAAGSPHPSGLLLPRIPVRS